MTAAKPGSLGEHLADKRVEELEEQLRRAHAENQLWREWLAKTRDTAVNFSPVVGCTQALEHVREVMSNPEALDEAVTAYLRGDPDEPRQRKATSVTEDMIVAAQDRVTRLKETQVRYGVAAQNAERALGDLQDRFDDQKQKAEQAVASEE